MKYIFTLLAFVALHAGATTHTITFAPYSYTPDSINVAVGDTVVWQGSFSNHPLSSTQVPGGAATFHNGSGSSFSYPVTVAGTYRYACDFHGGSGMKGVFIASASQPGSTDPSPYCNAGFDDFGGSIVVDDAVYSVTLSTLHYASNSQYPAPHYVYYNQISASPDLNRGDNYNLELILNVVGGAGYGVWIDFNRDNVFDTLNEKVAGTTLCNLPLGVDTINTTITIPWGATDGLTRMRVRIVEDDIFNADHLCNIYPCNIDTSAANTMDWGETEDYNVSIATATLLQQQEELRLSVYPNPANAQLLLLSNERITAYKIFDQLGQIVQVAQSNGSSLVVDISSLNSGSYFIKVFRDDFLISGKTFIKQD